MKTPYIFFLSFFLLLISCKENSLMTICKFKKSLKESSALELIPSSDLLWTIEDSNNQNAIYGINHKGKIIKKVKTPNITNKDWEDLASDHKGNLYIGDFGNNNGKRNKFQIYKIPHTFINSSKINAEIIEFKLPKKMTSKDFEAFFLFKGHFYIFSKESGKSFVFKVPNKIGKHKAKLLDMFNLKGKDNQITAADISADGKTIVLLNHDKLWKIDNFKSDDFFDGDIEPILLNHKSQKEGICFKNKNTVYISDEFTGKKTGNVYEFELP